MMGNSKRVIRSAHDNLIFILSRERLSIYAKDTNIIYARNDLKIYPFKAQNG